jgi:hypothetical protein
VCGVSKCDGEATTVRRPWPNRGPQAMEKNVELLSHYKLNYFLLLQASSLLT